MIPFSDYAKDQFVSLSGKYNITLVEWNHDIDIFIFCSEHNPTVNDRNSSMPIKVPVQDLSRGIFLMFVKSYGKKCFGQEVFVC
ncbi:hypothetical protein GCM10008934_13800 [Virgibacillus salarius]